MSLPLSGMLNNWHCLTRWLSCSLSINFFSGIISSAFFYTISFLSVLNVVENGQGVKGISLWKILYD